MNLRNVKRCGCYKSVCSARQMGLHLHMAMQVTAHNATIWDQNLKATAAMAMAHAQSGVLGIGQKLGGRQSDFFSY